MRPRSLHLAQRVPGRAPRPTATSSFTAFRCEGAKPKRSRTRIEARIQSGAAVSLADQLAWLDGLFRVPALFHHLVVNADRYDAVILSPYLFWTTVTGATVVPERTIVMPCLHDEPYATLDVLKPVLADVRAAVVPVGARASARASARDASAPRRDRRRRAHPRRLRPRRLSRPPRSRASVRPVRRAPRGRQGMGLAAGRVPLRHPAIRRCRSISSRSA